MLRSVDINDYMLRSPIKAYEYDDVFSAIKLITENKISGICIVDADDNLVGVLSELDCLKAILSSIYNQSGSVGKVADFMTSDVEYCKLHEDVVSVANDMMLKGHRRRPVVDDAGKLIGQITCRQLLRMVSEFNDIK